VHIYIEQGRTSIETVGTEYFEIQKKNDTWERSATLNNRSPRHLRDLHSRKRIGVKL
jgi:hypothetical protein